MISDKICIDVCDVNDMLNNVSTTGDNNNVSICANCGKDGANNICNKCKQVKYCNAVCKKVHKKKHKTDCEEYQRLATEKRNEELRIAAELHDKRLFKQPPPKDDCPICFLLLPSFHTGSKYMGCCGKTVCSGCIYAPVYDNQGNKVDNKKCPFCRTPHHASEEELLNRYKIRMEAGDTEAINNLGVFYREGVRGFPQDHTKALEHWHRAAELGHAGAYLNIGYSYMYGKGVKVDEKKGQHYYEQAAMRGNAIARCNIGVHEQKAGNMDRALRHWMIAIRDGYAKSLEAIKILYSNEYATKEDYTKALQSYQTYLGEIKSKQRDEAAAADEENRYY